MALVTSASAITLTENFTIDPNWDALNNRTGGQNYGWSNTDFTGSSVNPPGGTATGAGEIGGVIKRAGSPDNMYGVNFGNVTLDQPFTASGVLRLVTPDGGSGFNLGFYDAGNFYGSGGDAHNFVGMLFDDGHTPYSVVCDASGGRDRDGPLAALNLPTGVTVPFSMSYNPDPGDFGELVVMVNGAFYTHVLDSTRPGVGTLNRFGFFPVSADGAASTVYLDDLTITTDIVVVPPPTWASNSSGDWNVATNWIGGVPNGVDAHAHFLGAISQGQTVFTDTGVTVGSIEFDNANTYVIAGAGSLAMDVSTGSAQLSVLNGSQKINLPLFLNDNTIATVASGATLTVADPMTLVGGSSLTKSGPGTMNIISQVNSPSAASFNTTAGTVNAHFDLGTNVTLNATGGTTNFHSSQHLAAVNVGSGATVHLVAGGNKILVTKSASLAGTGKIDLHDNDAVIDYTGPVGTLVNDVRAHLAAGRLTTSSGTPTTGLGYADNATLSPVKTSFSGETVDPSSLLIKFTYFGDADLDGDVDVADLGKLATSWQTSNNWQNGDFDYNGTVNVNDLGLLATNWQQGVGNPLGPSLGEALASLGLPSASVPEPGTLVGLVLGTFGAFGWRKRRR
jgi:hypothetical protein